MFIRTRGQEYILPTYSLTGDILGFLRCGLQYRYLRVGGLASSKPVQLWFGQFIHSVMEEAYREYSSNRLAGNVYNPGWPEVEAICDEIKKRLAIMGLEPGGQGAYQRAKQRAFKAITELGPHLFPIIAEAERRLSGTRKMLPLPQQLQGCNPPERYELAGVVDVITHVQLQNPALQSNLLVKEILSRLPSTLPQEFEVIVDYKGMRRPEISNPIPGLSLWQQLEWQIRTYAYLRSLQENSLPVIAGVLIYINELDPTKDDLKALLDECQRGTTDIVPQSFTGISQDIQSIITGQSSMTGGDLLLDFRMKRSLHVVPVDDQLVQQAVHEFDKVVTQIQVCQLNEKTRGQIIQTWDQNNSDPDTCTACDFETICDVQNPGGAKTPKLPGM